MGDKLNQKNKSAENNLRHFFKATDFDDIAMKVKIMKLILNIPPYFVLAFLRFCEIVVTKRFVSVAACLIHKNYQSESMVDEFCPILSQRKKYRKPHCRSLVKGFVKMTENNYVIKEDQASTRH